MGSSPASTGASPAIPSRKRSRGNSDKEVVSGTNSNSVDGHDFTSNLPDELLARVFHFLRSGDRKTCSAVCRRWLRVDGESRHRLYLKGNPDILSTLPSIFTRFGSVTRLTLGRDQVSASISVEALVLISMKCTRLVSLHLCHCRELTDLGIASFAANCKTLRKFVCGSCNFGTKGINAVIEHCVNLEEIKIKALRGIRDGADPMEPGAAALNLRSISLQNLINGDWDDVLLTLGRRNNSRLLRFSLTKISVSDVGISGIANCKQVKTLSRRILRISNVGLTAIGENCKLLRKLHIAGTCRDQLGDEGFVAIATKCVNLQELVLINIKVTYLSLALIASNCKGLKRLGLCISQTISDTDISCIATGCEALRMVRIDCCPISDLGIKYLALGCPNLVKIKVQRCRGVTNQIAEWLKEQRGSLVFVDDNGVQEAEFF